jgi:hypothetical protein
MSRLSFRKLPRSLLEAASNQELWESVWEEIASQVEDRPFTVNPDKLAGVPDDAQSIYWLRLFEAEVGTNGMEVFILEWLGLYAEQIHTALRAVGASELVRRLEAAIPFALGTRAAEFQRLPDLSWYKRCPPSRDYPTLQSVDKGIHPIVDSLTDAVAAFIRRSENILFDADAGSENAEGNTART